MNDVKYKQRDYRSYRFGVKKTSNSALEGRGRGEEVKDRQSDLSGASGTKVSHLSVCSQLDLERIISLAFCDFKADLT